MNISDRGRMRVRVAVLSALMWAIHAGMAVVVIVIVKDTPWLRSMVALIIATAVWLVLWAAITERIGVVKKEVSKQWQK